MTKEEKIELVKMIQTSYPQQIFAYAKDKGYDYDMVFSLIVQYSNEVMLDYKLDMEWM